jgi:hypothetical protein
LADIPEVVMADKQRRVLDILGVVLAASTLPASAPPLCAEVTHAPNHPAADNR